jgi:UDP-N-acetylmuramate--alanine ligase
VLLVTEIYAASEKPIEGVSGERLVQTIAAHGHHQLHYCPTLDDALKCLQELATPGDVVITLGAGNIWQVGESLLANLAQAPPAVGQ